MTHFQYLLGLVLFVLGNSFLIFYFRLYSKYSFRFLKFLFLHILFSFLIVFLQIAKIYIAVNARHLIPAFTVVQIPLSGLFIIMLTATYALFIQSLFENRAPRSRKVYLFILVLSVSATMLTGNIYYFLYDFSPLLLSLEYVYAAALILASLLLILDGKISDIRENRQVIRLFGLGYLIWSVPFVIHLMVPLNPSLYLYLFCQAAQFIFPYFWFKYYFLKRHTLANAYLRDRDCLNSIYRVRKITSREKEIIELILRGKSNREIEKELFISIYTVKNHVQNIYAKLGVRSRTKLIQMILDSQRQISS